ncbi:hypothetical protein HPB49_026189 [Dermacentor silvarum]|nr:hypothetical protein HPB49_026189 [Dermacentor silvarum]
MAASPRKASRPTSTLTPSSPMSPRSPRALYARLITSPPKQKRSALRVTTVLAAVAATLLGVCVLVLFVLFSRWSPQKLALCTTTACSEFAKLIAYSVNQSVDPCSDFDVYVCSGWRFQQKHSVYKAVAINAVDAMTKVIRKGRSPAHPDQSMAQKISLFYRSCDDVWRGERDELPVVREHLLRAGVVWPRISAAPDVLRTLLVLSIELDWAVVFQVLTHEKIVWMDVPYSFKLAIGERQRLHDLHAWRQSFDYLKTHFAEGDAKGTATFEEAINFENKFFRPLVKAMTPVLVRGPVSIVLDEGKWRERLAELNVTSVVKFQAFNIRYVRTFLYLWNRWGEASTHAFVSWMAVRYTSLFANRDLVFNSYGTANGDTIKYEQGRFCYALVYRFIGDYLFVPYNAQVFSPDVSRDVERILVAIRSEFAARLSAIEPHSSQASTGIQWDSLETVMSVLNQTIPKTEESRRAANALLPDMNVSLAGNWQAALKARRLHGWASVPRKLGSHAINKLSLHSYWDGDIVLAPYALSFPLYDEYLADAVKYGAFGTVVALTFAELALMPYAAANATVGGTVRDALTCARNSSRRNPWAMLADLTSLDVVTHAYEARGSHDTLAGNFTATQLFFVSWCFVKCRGFSEPLGNECNAAARNVPAFREAFSCPTGDPLNPEEKCTVF